MSGDGVTDPLRTREDREQEELADLAPWAMAAVHSGGRVHDEPHHRFRTVFQRDRDRVIHCTAFRRLAYKTQVFVSHEGDHYRTRLTHTLEVSQIARNIARALRLNEDLTEAHALAHDLGHPPFGHSGEDALHAVMLEHGGFEHNRHGLRTVEVIERRYPDFPGLNLTREVREVWAKRRRTEGRKGNPRPEDFPPDEGSLLEAQVADAADSIAYNNHDLDDGLASGILDEADLAGVDLWAEARAAVETDWPDIEPVMGRRQTVRRLINWYVTDLIEETARRLQAAGIADLDDVRAADEPLVGFSPHMAERIGAMEKFLHRRMYRQSRVARMQNKAKRLITEVFEAYVADPAILPETWQVWTDEHGLHRGVCDYVAGMTDRHLLDEHRRLFDPHERV